MKPTESKDNCTDGVNTSTFTAQPENAICVRGAHKRYGSKKKQNIVLDGLNMTVPRGSIYGLLGASGCGKSTLLSCIMGLRRLNAGQVWVLGGWSSVTSAAHGPRIGYMPQELALFDRFTVREILIYYGWIAGMRPEEIEQRIEFLVPLLHLTDARSYIDQLSGGQQRRTSLAVALLHDPELLILDEPTAGVDQILRHDLWEHMQRVVSEGNRTIVITTHYIEEARRADVVGLMRRGRLLVESSPQSLMMKFGGDNLEDVFLILSDHQNNDVLPSAEVQCNETIQRCESNDAEVFGGGSRFIKPSHLKAIFWKNWLWLKRSPLMTAVILMMPFIQIIIFCTAIGHTANDLRLCVVNQELDALSTECNPSLPSCRYLNLLDTKCFKYELMQSEKVAEEELRHGRAWASMVIESDFSDSMVQRVNMSAERSLKQSHIVVRLDMSNHPISVLMKQDIQSAYDELTEELRAAININPKLRHLPLNFEKPIYGESTTTNELTDFVAPGVLLSIIFVMSDALATSALMKERHQGMLERSLAAGVTVSEIIISYLVIQMALMCGKSVTLLLGGYAVFGLTLYGSIMDVSLLILLTGFCGICFGFLIGSVCDNPITASFLSISSLVNNLMMCGIMWPLDGMHPVLRFVARFWPMSTATESLRSIMLRGSSIGERDVYVGFVGMGIWSLLFMCGCIVVMRFRKV